MPKLVDEVLLMLLQELNAPVATPTVDDFLYFGYASGGIGRKIKILDLADVISSQLGTAANVPDRVYRPYVDMPAGASIGNGSDYGFFGSNNVIIDPYLDGRVYSFFRRGVELSVKGVEWQNDIPGGGARLTTVGDEFVEGDIITIQFKPDISSVISTPDAVGRFIDGEVIVTGTVSAGASHDRKLKILNGSTAAALTYTLNSSYPQFVTCPFRMVEGGTAKQAIIVPGAGTTMWDGRAVSKIILGEGESANLVLIGTVWRVISRSDEYKRVGTATIGGIAGPNQYYGNGQIVARNVLPRLSDWLDALAVNPTFPGSVVGINGNASQWGVDANNIRFPDVQGDFWRALDMAAGRDPGRIGANKFIINSRETMEVQEHNHTNGPYDNILISNNQNTVVNMDNSAGQPNLASCQPMLPYGGAETRPNNWASPLIYNV